MTPKQKAFCSNVMRLMGAFYEDPENERRFQLWKEKKQGRGMTAANDSRAPMGTAIHDGRGNHTASPTR